MTGSDLGFSADALADLVSSYNPRSNSDLIREAYSFGAQMHDGQFRHSGEPYFTHPIAVAKILAEQQIDDVSIITALLHDTIEDTKASFSQVAELFGIEVAEMVDGVTKLTNLELTSSESQQAENFRKLFLAMSRDIRVMLVKLADRLHNMRTLKAMRQEKQMKKARETMDIYAPLAGRMGMQWMRDELEDLAFEVINHDARLSIMRRFVTLQKDAGDVIEQITHDMRIEFDNANVKAEVTGRAKRPYSIWRKMQEKELTFSRLSDIYGFRVIVDQQADCYRALGVVHQCWRAVPGRFKDYVSQPKSNGYRSIHTTVSGRDGTRVEVQIRTREMHEVAETGVAAHWSYKNGERVENRFAVDPVRWISQLKERLDDDYDHDEFLEAVRLEMYVDQVFCFTPRGDVIKLPKGATPIDFAYAIHTRIGHSCVGAKVDGLRVPLWSRLRNGQQVEVITAAGQTPQATWVDIAYTGRAKSAIRRALRAEERSRFVRFGREIAEAALEHVNHKVTDKGLEQAAKTLGLGGTEDLLASLGAAEIRSSQIVTALYPEFDEEPLVNADVTRPVIGLSAEQSSHRAKCCQPLPGERIVGITFRGKGVVVHTIDCNVLAKYEDMPERWVDLGWKEGRHPPVYDVTLDSTIYNDPGVLGRVCSIIGAKEANISDLEFIDRKPDYFRVHLEVELKSAQHLHQILTALRAEEFVSEVRRLRDPSRGFQSQKIESDHAAEVE